jgi:hypothetical protein
MKLAPSRIVEGVVVGLIVAAIGALALKLYRAART